MYADLEIRLVESKDEIFGACLPGEQQHQRSRSESIQSLTSKPFNWLGWWQFHTKLQPWRFPPQSTEWKWKPKSFKTFCYRLLPSEVSLCNWLWNTDRLGKDNIMFQGEAARDDQRREAGQRQRTGKRRGRRSQKECAERDLAEERSRPNPPSSSSFFPNGNLVQSSLMIIIIWPR